MASDGSNNSVRVAELLEEASQLLRTTSACSTSSTSQSSSTTLSRAQRMIQQSASSGVFRRLNRNERLRAACHPYNGTSNTRTPSSLLKNDKQMKKSTKLVEKPIEFGLLDAQNDEDNDAGPVYMKWDSVVASGMILVNENDGEEAIRFKIKEALKGSFPLIGSHDFDFVKVRRKQISKMNLAPGIEYSYSLIKKMAGQGLLYLKIKEEFRFAIQGNDNKEDKENDDKLPIFQTAPTVTNTTASCSSSACYTTTKPPGQDDVIDLTARNDNCEKIDKTINELIEKKIVDPVEILRFLQKNLQEGRPLDLSSLTDFDENFNSQVGQTNYLSIDRNNLLESTFLELESITNYFLTYEIDFMGEEAKDLGGPRREWFKLCNNAIKLKYFDDGLRDLFAEKYFFVGILMGAALLQGGQLPRYIPHFG